MKLMTKFHSSLVQDAHLSLVQDAHLSLLQPNFHSIDFHQQIQVVEQQYRL